jgi:hypothetical protein
VPVPVPELGSWCLGWSFDYDFSGTGTGRTGKNREEPAKGVRVGERTGVIEDQ